MSDGAISQSEIDALLSGGLGGGASSTQSFTQAQQDTLQKFFTGVVPKLTANLSSMAGKEVSVSDPVVESIDREAFSVKRLPEMVVSSIADFEGTIQGEHLFITAGEFTQKLVGLVNHEENVAIDDMSLSVVSETISQYVGRILDSLDAAKVKGVSNQPVVSHYEAKDATRLPENFVLVSYSITIEDAVYDLWEVIAEKTAVELSNKLAGETEESKPQPAASGVPVQSSIQGNTMGVNVPINGMNPATQVPQPAMNTGIPMQGGMVMPGMNPNVQSIQFPALQNGVTSTEQGNIGLIMDVFMEMTVELGRTHKMIKEILSMGEGHIIELDKLAGEPVDILVNHKPIAKGEVVVIDENFGVRVTEILSPAERITDA